MYMKVGLFPNDISTKFALSKAYDEMYSLIVEIVNYYSNLTEQREKDRYRSDFIEFINEIYMSLRQLSEQLKSCDTTLTDSIGRLIFDINNLLISLHANPEFTTEQRAIEERLSWNIHLPTWFAHHTEKFDAGCNPFNTLTDCVAKTGILVAEKMKNKKLLIACVSALNSFTIHALKKGTDSHGYDEPRILEKACYLGILALKKGWLDVFADIKVKIIIFEPQFFAKYFTNIPTDIDPENHNVIGLPHKDQLLRELIRWRDDYEKESRNGLLRIRDDAEAMMYELVTVYDIDKFIFEVWDIFFPDSQFGEEMELKLARQELIKSLKKIRDKL